MILCIETATQSCSVALADNGKVVAVRESFGQNNHSGQITLFIDEVMKEAYLSYNQLDAVAVSMGPGSYTGLRIGVSTAKGICYAVNKPLIAVDTLESIAEVFKADNQIEANDIICPMIDARRMEVYAAFFNSEINKVEDTKAIVLDEHSFDKYTANHHVKLVGDGADKCTSLYADIENVEVISGVRASAKGMAKATCKAFDEKRFVDVAYFEPFYLKDFVAGSPKVKGLI